MLCAKQIFAQDDAIKPGAAAPPFLIVPTSDDWEALSMSHYDQQEK